MSQSSIAQRLAAAAPILLMALTLMLLASVAGASEVSSIIDEGKSQMGGISKSVSGIVQICLYVGALIGLGIAIWGSVIQFHVMKLVGGVGVIIVCLVGVAIVKKFEEKATAAEKTGSHQIATSYSAHV